MWFVAWSWWHHFFVFQLLWSLKCSDLCWSMEHHSGGYFEPVLWSLAPYLRGLDVAPWRDDKAHLFFWFLLLLLACHPEDEKLALAVHISISIPTSLQVIACFGSLWWDTSGLFYDCSFTFADLGGLPGWS